MVLQRARLLEPVVLMGETGVGKTYLVKYVAEVLFGPKSRFCPFTLHPGVEDSALVGFMQTVIDDARRSAERFFWVFFDEFNTSGLQPYVAELLNDRVFSLSDQPESRPETNRQSTTAFRTTSSSSRRATRSRSSASTRTRPTTWCSRTPRERTCCRTECSPFRRPCSTESTTTASSARRSSRATSNPFWAPFSNSTPAGAEKRRPAETERSLGLKKT